MSSRRRARSGRQVSALTFASNPAARSAHIVVNIASLPSTVILVCGAGCGRGGGAATCAVLVCGTIPAINVAEATAIHIRLDKFFMNFAEAFACDFFDFNGTVKA